MIRTLVADDSPTFREALIAILKQDGEFDVVGAAETGPQTVELACALRPNLVIMDVLMPGITGLAATERIMSLAPCAVVVMSGLMNVVAHRLVFEAMRAGAVEVVGKPPNLIAKGTREPLLALLKAMSGVKVVRRRRPVTDPPMSGRDLGFVAIGCSTGGPPALREILRHLPKSFPAPVVVAQHLAAGFVRGLCSWLGDSLDLEVQVAEMPLRPMPGHVYLAPDDHHLEVRGGVLTPVNAGTDTPAPSVDRLFSSLVDSPAGVIALLLTGMGSDGAHGLKLLRGRGFHTIVQDEATSLIYGMPKVATELGAASEQLPLHEMGHRLLELARRATQPGDPPTPAPRKGPLKIPS
jgi:two-component system, chemotaxis family, protein-glutamate methylesterase/glutaminase